MPPTTPKQPQIISATDTDTPLKLMEAHLAASGDDPFTYCPWVKVGNLYMSVTMTGDSSWKSLVDLIRREQPDALFTVFSGRHGTQAGQAVSNKEGLLSKDFVLDGDFYAADVAAAKSYNGAVEVIDAKDYKTTANLQKETLTRLANRKVIYGWCHSLFAAMDHSEELYSEIYQIQTKKSQPKKYVAVESRALWLSNKPVKELVTEWYGWVPTAVAAR